MGKTLLIVNPCSGKAKMKTELLNVVNILSADGSLVTVYPTKARGDATEFAAGVKNSGLRRRRHLKRGNNGNYAVGYCLHPRLHSLGHA